MCNITLTQLTNAGEGKIQRGKEPNGVHDTYRIFMISDDDAVCERLSGILESKGYKTAGAANVDRALNLLRNQYFDVTLIDIRLADKDGLYFLQRLKKMVPEMIKIVVTGYPSVCNVVEALDLGATACLIKPIDPQELLETIRSKIEARARFEDTYKERLAEWTDKQAKNAESKNFHEFLQDMTVELAMFGLTANQAKVYVTLVSVGLASALEVATSSGIRREEVYRIMPELEKIGIVTRKIGTPQKFLPVSPEDATLVLIKSKLATVAQEIDVLDAKRNIIASNLKKFNLLPHKVATSIDSIPATRNLYTRLVSMMKRAEKNIDAVLPYKCVLHMQWAHEDYRSELHNHSAEETKFRAPAKMQIITENKAHTNQSHLIKQLSLWKYELSVKYMDQVPFSAFMIDDTEALWGRFDLRDDNNHNLWTNDQVQITILKTAFENLWKNAQSPSSNSG